MTKCIVMSISLCFVMMLLLQHVNTGAIIVQSSASGFSTSCGGINCRSGNSCSVSFSATGYNSTKITLCGDSEGKYHREQITTTFTGNLVCITNTTDVNGKVTILKNCSEISPQELKQRQEEWKKQMNMVREGEEKLNKLLEYQEQALEKQQQAMEQAMEKHEKAMEEAMEQHEKAMEEAMEQREKALEQEMLQREKVLEMQQEAMDRQFENWQI